MTGDLTEFGLHAGGGDNGGSPAVDGGGPGEHHVPAVADTDVLRHGGGVLLDRRRLAGERRLISFQIDGFEEPGISRNPVAGTDDHDVARDQLPGGELLLTIISEGGGGGGGHALQCFQRPFGAVLLDEPQTTGKKDNDTDNDGVDRFADNRRQDDGDKQDNDEKTLELLEKEHPRGHPGLTGQFIGAGFQQALFGLSGGQPPGARLQSG